MESQIHNARSLESIIKPRPSSVEPGARVKELSNTGSSILPCLIRYTSNKLLLSSPRAYPGESLVLIRGLTTKNEHPALAGYTSAALPRSRSIGYVGHVS